MYQFKKSITIGECLLLHQSGFAIPCRNGKPIGVIDEYGDNGNRIEVFPMAPRKKEKPLMKATK